MPGLRSHLRRFWFSYDGLAPGHRAGGLGCGVTAESRAAAESLLRAELFGGAVLPAPTEVLEDVDIRDLDPGHVVPNMGDPSTRGVWFPR
ncbi:MAG: hypothetical protein ACR2NH_12975 [Solirubrobacteraceae bacterium]